jgi:hypothetical protein
VALDHAPPVYSSCISGMTGTYHHAQHISSVVLSPTFCLDWPQTVVLPSTWYYRCETSCQANQPLLISYPPPQSYVGIFLRLPFYFSCMGSLGLTLSFIQPRSSGTTFYYCFCLCDTLNGWE